MSDTIRRDWKDMPPEVRAWFEQQQALDEQRAASAEASQGGRRGAEFIQGPMVNPRLRRLGRGETLVEPPTLAADYYREFPPLKEPR